MAICKKCGKSLGGFFSSARKIRGEEYCWKCSDSIPSCDKCKYHYKNELYPNYGCCAHFNQYLQDYDNVCEAYAKGSQVHPDVYV